MNNIFKYLNAIDFINDRFNELKLKNPAFSLRAWAKKMEMKSHGPLHAILKKQRNIPKKLVPKLITTLKLTSKEAKYFEALVDYQRAKDSEEKEFYKEKLEKLSPSKLREFEDLEAYKVITDPIHIAISEMTQLKNFQDSDIWIKQHLRFGQNLRDISIIMDRLKKLGVIKTERGKVKKLVDHIYTKFEVQSEDIQNYHKTCSKLAIDQVSNQTLNEKEFNAITFNIKHKDLPKLKEDIRDFINKTVQEYEAKPQQGEETYQLNVQLFSLTKS